MGQAEEEATDPRKGLFVGFQSTHRSSNSNNSNSGGSSGSSK